MAIKELVSIKALHRIIRWTTTHHRKNTTRQTDSNNGHIHNSTKNHISYLNP
jgi:hypothetical protein